MNELPEQPRPPGRSIGFGIGSGKIGLLGLILAPIAILVYLIALPLFGLFWLIEWLLPLHPAEHKSFDEPFRAMEIAAPPKHD
jgi:hypothetical protein